MVVPEEDAIHRYKKCCQYERPAQPHAYAAVVPLGTVYTGGAGGGWGCGRCSRYDMKASPVAAILRAVKRG